jgi:predicted HTH domain antitoxin
MHIIINIDNTIANLKPIANNDIPADLPADIYFRFMKNLMFRIKPYSGAVKTLQYISEYMDIIYTTARPTEASFVTVRWLEINGFPSGQILFLPPNQRLFPDAAGIIDDDPRVARLKHRVKIGGIIMDTVKIELEIPRVLAEYADINSEEYKKKINQIMLYELVKNEKISIGKAAEAMGMRIIDFITDLGKMDIPYFDFSLEELMEDVKSARPSVVESE